MLAPSPSSTRSILRAAVRAAVAAVVDDLVVPRLDSSRWVVVRDGRGLLGGLALARLPLAASVAVLALHPDGSHGVVLALAARVVAASERDARFATVSAGRRPGMPPDHPFAASPILPEFCALCVLPSLAHDRAAVEEAIRGRLGGDVRVEFRDATARVAAIAHRPPRVVMPPRNPVPGEEAKSVVAPPREPWRILAADEVAAVRAGLSLPAPDADLDAGERAA